VGKLAITAMCAVAEIIQHGLGSVRSNLEHGAPLFVPPAIVVP
jgi:hypothetical protein